MRLGDYLDVEELNKLIKSKHIRVQRHPDLSLAILNYSNECLFDDFWTETIQKCRGLIINPVANHEICGDCQIISRPFHKFFNLNHSSQPDYHEANLPTVVPTVTEKMDGWFGILWKCGNVGGEPLSMVPNWDPESRCHYGIASRGSFTSDGARFGSSKLGKLIKYGAIHEFPEGYSAVFEIIFKAGRIVVDYSFEGLVLLALINNETGEEMPYEEMRTVWAKIASYSQGTPWIRLVHAHDLGATPINTIKQIEIGDYFATDPEHPEKFDRPPQKMVTKNQEGFVLTYPRPGTFPIKVKVKFEDYKRLHRIITGVTPQVIWKAVHDPMAPWVGGEVPAHFREWALKWRDDLYQKFNNNLYGITALAECGLTRFGDIDFKNSFQRKEMFEFLNEENPKSATIAIALLEGKIYDAYQAIWNRIKPVGREETFYKEGQGE